MEKLIRRKRKLLFSILAVLIVVFGVNYAASLAWNPSTQRYEAAALSALLGHAKFETTATSTRKQ